MDWPSGRSGGGVSHREGLTTVTETIVARRPSGGVSCGLQSYHIPELTGTKHERFACHILLLFRLGSYPIYPASKRNSYKADTSSVQ
jgi:hypothetical protein